MRRTDKEITDPNLLQDILINSQICRLGLVDNSEAYIVPVNYAFVDGYIYIHSASEGRKIEILKRNPKAAFEIEYPSETIRGEIPCKWGTRYRSVMGKGTIVIDDDIESKKNGFDALMRKYGAEFALVYDESALAKAVLLKLRIESLTGKQSGIW
ncbi:MAG TPA: pyridoxamine 5'-phosphate oxidase family protein [Candidatus Acidoferrales bacterium]|nr:pyridoxamine 5'-phosphate oxidase family protein [Candidatus Acidoferrales bacterium]